MNSQIITFYSWKGGVGRTMALANIGVLLAAKGKKVLIVDWDLEAPGLESYFKLPQESGIFTSEITPADIPSGLLGLLTEADQDRNQASKPNYWRKFCRRIELNTFTGLQHSSFPLTASIQLDLLSSGFRSEGYSSRLGSFSWERFFASWRPREWCNSPGSPTPV